MAGELRPDWYIHSPFIERHVRDRVRGKSTNEDTVNAKLRGNIVEEVGNIIADLGFPAYPPKQLHFDVNGNKFETVKPTEEPLGNSD